MSQSARPRYFRRRKLRRINARSSSLRQWLIAQAARLSTTTAAIAARLRAGENYKQIEGGSGVAPSPTKFLMATAGQSLVEYPNTRGLPRAIKTFGFELKTNLGLEGSNNFINQPAGNIALRRYHCHNGTGADTVGVDATSTNWTLKIVNTAVGGTALLDVSNTGLIANQNYWYNTQNNTATTGNVLDVANSPGRRWRDCIAFIENAFTTEGRNIDAFLWGQGTADSVATMVSDATRRLTYKQRLYDFFVAVRTASGNANLPIFIQRHGRHNSVSDANYGVIRDIQNELVSGTSFTALDGTTVLPGLTNIHIASDEYDVQFAKILALNLGSTTNGSNTIFFSDTSQFAVNKEVKAGNIPAGATVASINANTSITLQTGQNATSTSTTVLFETEVAGLGTTTLNSKVIPMTSTAGLKVGSFISGSGIQPATEVRAIDPGVSITVNFDCTASASNLKIFTTVVPTVNTTNGNLTVACSATRHLTVGQIVAADNIPDGAWIASIATDTSFTLQTGFAPTSTASGVQLYRIDDVHPYPGADGAEPLTEALATTHDIQKGFYAIVRRNARTVANKLGAAGILTSGLGPRVTGIATALAGTDTIDVNVELVNGTDITVPGSTGWRVTVDGVAQTISSVSRVNANLIRIVLSANITGTNLLVWPVYGALNKTIRSQFVRDNSIWQAPLQATAPIAYTISASLDSDTTALIDAIIAAGGTVSTPRRGVINTLITALKSAGTWTLCDGIWIMAAENATSGTFNWKAPTGTRLTLNNSPAFTTDRGWTGNGTNTWIGTGFNPQTATGINYAQDNAHVFVYAQDFGNSANSLADNSASRVIVRARSSTNGLIRVNATTSTSMDSGAGSNPMSVMGLRRSSTEQLGFANGIYRVTGTVASNATMPLEFEFLRANAGVYSTQTLYAVTAGSAFSNASSEAQALAHHTAIKNYLSAIGAPN